MNNEEIIENKYQEMEKEFLNWDRNSTEYVFSPKQVRDMLKQKDEELKEKIDGLKVEKFKPIDEKDGFHMKGWNDALKELKQKIFSEKKA